MKISEKLVQIAENEKKVYDAGYTEGINKGGYADGYEEGKKAESEAFWNGFTDNGNRTNYYKAFSYWGAEYIRPNRKIIPTTVDSGYTTFFHNPKLKKVESAYFDFSQKPRGTNSSNTYFYTFYNCPELEEVEDIGIQADFNFEYSFAQCFKLHTIAKLRSDEDTKFNMTFTQCQALKNISFDGVIGQTINFAYCKELSAESIKDIFAHLSDTASEKTLYLSDTAINNAEWDDSVKYIGYSRGPVYSNTISIPQGYKLKVELIVDDDHCFGTATWDDSQYQWPEADPNYWYFGLYDKGYLTRSYIVEGGTDHTVQVEFIRYTVNDTPAIFSVRAVLVDNDGNEVPGENLFSAIEVEGVVTNVGGWETLRDSKPNWIISY